MAQMIGYLNITSLQLALLLNFKNARLVPISLFSLIRAISVIRGENLLGLRLGRAVLFVVKK
jgi:hypothetical protein